MVDPVRQPQDLPRGEEMAFPKAVLQKTEATSNKSTPDSNSVDLKPGSGYFRLAILYQDRALCTNRVSHNACSPQ